MPLKWMVWKCASIIRWSETYQVCAGGALSGLLRVSALKCIQATRRTVLCPENPTSAKENSAVGGSHTFYRYIWPITLSIQARRQQTRARKFLLDQLGACDGGTGVMHESTHVDDPTLLLVNGSLGVTWCSCEVGYWITGYTLGGMLSFNWFTRKESQITFKTLKIKSRIRMSFTSWRKECCHAYYLTATGTWVVPTLQKWPPYAVGGIIW